MKKKVKEVPLLVVRVIILLLFLIILISLFGSKHNNNNNNIQKSPTNSCIGPYKEEIKAGCTSLTNPSYRCCSESTSGEFHCVSKVVKRFNCKNPDGISKSYDYVSSYQEQMFDDKLYPLYDAYTIQRVRCKAGFPELYETTTTTKEYKREYNNVLKKDQSCLTTSGNIVEKSNVLAGFSTNFADSTKINHPTYAIEYAHSSSKKYTDTPLKTGFKENHEATYDETVKRTAIRGDYETKNEETRYFYRWFKLSVTKSLVTNNQYGKTNSSGTCDVYFKPRKDSEGYPPTYTAYKLVEKDVIGPDYNCYTMLNIMPGEYRNGELDSSAAFTEMDRGIVTKVMPVDETPQEPGTSTPFYVTYPGISGFLEY